MLTLNHFVVEGFCVLWPEIHVWVLGLFNLFNLLPGGEAAAITRQSLVGVEVREMRQK